MAQRTTPLKVREVLPPDTPANVNFQPFIDTASPLVDWLVTQDTNSVLVVSLLERIECFLAAHYYHQRDHQYQQKNTGRSSGQFQGQTGFVLMNSFWGQQACMLDVTGILAEKSKQAEQGMRAVARVRWLGTPSQSPNRQVPGNSDTV